MGCRWNKHPVIPGWVRSTQTRNPAVWSGSGFRVRAKSAPRNDELGRLVEQLPSDQHAADFAGAGADLVQFCVAQQSSRRIVVDVAVAAEQLDRIERALRRLFRGI